jgi:hypothetical protein
MKRGQKAKHGRKEDHGRRALNSNMEFIYTNLNGTMHLPRLVDILGACGRHIP